MPKPKADQNELVQLEIERLVDKLERLDDWLDDHHDMKGTEKYAHREDVWFSTERKYRRMVDRNDGLTQTDFLDGVEVIDTTGSVRNRKAIGAG